MKNFEYVPQLYTQHLLKQGIIIFNKTEIVNQEYRVFYNINSRYILNYKNLNNIISLIESYKPDEKFHNYEIIVLDNQKYYIHHNPEEDILIYKNILPDIYYKDLVLINGEIQDSVLSIIFCNKHRQFDEIEFYIPIQEFINTIIKSYKDVINKGELFIEEDDLEGLKNYITDKVDKLIENIEELKNDN